MSSNRYQYRLRKFIKQQQNPIIYYYKISILLQAQSVNEAIFLSMCSSAVVNGHPKSPQLEDTHFPAQHISFLVHQQLDRVMKHLHYG